MTVYAPELFHGDISSYLGGTISFDGKNIGGTDADLSTTPWFGTVTITGTGGTASFGVAGSGTGNPANDGLWHSYSAALDPLLWSGDLAGAMGDVTAISVVLEFGDIIVETAGFDNFQVAAVPLPGAMPLFLSALAFLGLGRARRIARQGA